MVRLPLIIGAAGTLLLPASSAAQRLEAPPRSWSAERRR
jgi:hypothetical protein